MRKFIYLLIFGVLSATTICAAERSAEELLTQCTSTDSEVFKLACASYMHGFGDAVAVLASIDSASSRVCLPKDGISADQLRRIVVKWLEDHPKELHAPASFEVLIALVDAFPCKK